MGRFLFAKLFSFFNKANDIHSVGVSLVLSGLNMQDPYSRERQLKEGVDEAPSIGSIISSILSMV
jgi:hypothetical protein